MDEAVTEHEEGTEDDHPSAMRAGVWEAEDFEAAVEEGSTGVAEVMEEVGTGRIGLRWRARFRLAKPTSEGF